MGWRRWWRGSGFNPSYPPRGVTARSSSMLGALRSAESAASGGHLHEGDQCRIDSNIFAIFAFNISSNNIYFGAITLTRSNIYTGALKPTNYCKSPTPTTPYQSERAK